MDRRKIDDEKQAMWMGVLHHTCTRFRAEPRPDAVVNRDKDGQRMKRVRPPLLLLPLMALKMLRPHTALVASFIKPIRARRSSRRMRESHGLPDGNKGFHELW
jgi:hypothetical protein